MKSTWETAIRKHYFQTWPGLTPQLLTHLSPSIATVQDHLHKQRQNLQSTKSQLTSQPQELEELEYIHPMPPLPNKRTQQVVYSVINRQDLITAYKDLTGRFPIRSAAGSEYIMIGYHYDASCILGHPVTNQTAPVLTKAWEHLQSQFGRAGVASEVWVLDNEISKELTEAFTTLKLLQNKTQLTNWFRHTLIDEIWPRELYKRGKTTSKRA